MAGRVSGASGPCRSSGEPMPGIAAKVAASGRREAGYLVRSRARTGHSKSMRILICLLTPNSREAEMVSFFRVWLVVQFLLVHAATAQETTGNLEDPEDMFFEVSEAGGAFSDLIGVLPTLESHGQMISGGAIADWSDFTATFVQQYTHADGWQRICTATMIGPALILTAAHCVPKSRKITLRRAGRKYEAICEIAAGYRADTKLGQTRDFALCVLNDRRQLRLTTYETISISSADTALGDKLMITGVGCIAYKLRADRKLRQGIVEVTGLPAGSSDHLQLGWIGANGSGRVSMSTLCSGDSGGPTFKVSGANRLTPRTIVAVNSQTVLHCTMGGTVKDCPSKDVALSGMAYASALARPEFTQLLHVVEQKHNVRACVKSRLASQPESHCQTPA